MTSADPDRNLLFGVIALQTDAITRTQFIDGCALWASQKERPLADLLAERKLDHAGGSSRRGAAGRSQAPSPRRRCPRQPGRAGRRCGPAIAGAN